MSEKSKINRKKRREHEEKEAKNVIKYIFIALIILFCINEWLRNRKKVYCEQGKSI